MVFTSADARKLIRRLMQAGNIALPAEGEHGRKEMNKDTLKDVDALNVLRGGVVREAEWENGAWRYRVETPRMVFVITFDPEPDWSPSDEELPGFSVVVITGWRTRK